MKAPLPKMRSVSVSEPQARLAVRNCEDLVGLVPYLIGFHPVDSLVTIVLEEGCVVVTARVDLVAVTEPDGLASLLGRLFDRFPRADCWFLAYTDDASLAWSVLGGCVGIMGALRGAKLIQVGSLWWRAESPEGPTGRVSVSASAAEAAVLGMPALPSREALADRIVGPPQADVDDLRARFTSGQVEIERIGARGRRRLLTRLLASASPPAVGDCVRLALLVERPEGQVLTLRGLSRRNAEAQVALWTTVIRHCLIDYQPAPLGLLGMAAWQTGDGALQMVCLERMERLAPRTPIGAVIEVLNTEVVPPSHWAGLREHVAAALEAELTVAGRPASPHHR